MPGSGSLHRTALLERLDHLLDVACTIVSAPAGSGKTTLLRQWAERSPLPVTWIDLDDGDSVALEPGFAGVVVIDDRRTGGPDRAYADLASTVGDGVHVVALTRAAPPVELAALRLRDVAWQLTTADLQLTDDDAAGLVAAHLGVDVDPALAAVAAEINQHHRGWITGVALAARSWPPDPTTPTTEAVLAASADAVEGYLLVEVVDGLPPEVRTFLARTAALPLLSAELCDAALASADANEQLTWLRRHGTFLEPSERGPDWWACHPQLRRAVRTSEPADPADRQKVIRTAAERYSELGLFFEAASSLADLRDWDAVRQLVSAQGPALFSAGSRLDDLIALFHQLPPEVYRGELPWALALATLELVDGKVASATSLLSSVQPLLAPDDAMRADCVRVIAVGWVEDTEPIIAIAESGVAACDRLGEDHEFFDVLNRSSVDHYRTLLRHGGLLAGAFAGDWATVERWLDPIRADTELELHPFIRCGILSQRAAYRALAGDARGALGEAARGLETAQEVGLADHHLLGETRISRGEALRLSGRTDEAAIELAKGLALSIPINRGNGIAMAVAAQAHLDVDAGRLDEALRRLADHRRDHDRRHPFTLAGLLVAAEGRALLALGHGDDARSVLTAGPRTAAVAVALVLAALEAGTVEEARLVLAEWPDDATVGSTVRRLLATVAVDEATGRRAEADAGLQAALVAAEPAELVQPFAELGRVLVGPLRRAGVGPTAEAVDEGADFLGRIGRAVRTAGGPASLPLTAQELAVLGHLARGQTLLDAAGEMYLSVNTVKTHVRSIYRKLGVTSRAEALLMWRRHGG